MDKVEIRKNEPSEGANISLEQQYQQQKSSGKSVEDYDKKVREALGENTEQPRPDWLPEKFNSPADMAKAYAELEAKLGGKSTEKTEPKQEQSKGDPKADDYKDTPIAKSIASATDEFEKDGKLSDETYAALEKQGIGRDYVDSYIAGLQGKADQQRGSLDNQLITEIGGADAWNTLASWGKDNLSDDEIDAFNVTMESGNVAAMRLAIAGVQAQMQKSQPKIPQLMQGKVNASAVTPYSSVDEVRADMRSKKYETSPAFRAEVQRRLAVSSVL